MDRKHDKKEPSMTGVDSQCNKPATKIEPIIDKEVMDD